MRPDILEKRLNAIKQLSQYTLDYEIRRHLGHGGDPRLAELQYMIDQGMMNHMPRSILVGNPETQFRASPSSIWTAFNPGSDSAPNSGKFRDQRLNLARTNIDMRYMRQPAENRPHIIADPQRSVRQTFTAMAGGNGGQYN